jgi:hypothetical protein
VDGADEINRPAVADEINRSRPAGRCFTESLRKRRMRSQRRSWPSASVSSGTLSERSRTNRTVVFL